MIGLRSSSNPPVEDLVLLAETIIALVATTAIGFFNPCGTLDGFKDETFLDSFVTSLKAVLFLVALGNAVDVEA